MLLNNALSWLVGSALMLAAGAAAAQGGPVHFNDNAPWAGESSRDADPPDGRDAATRQEFPSDAACRWLPFRAPSRAAAAAGAAALQAGIERIGAFFADDPKFATPRGVCMQFSVNAVRGTTEGGHALHGGFFIGAWPGEWLSRRQGRIVFDGETSHIVGDVNRMPTDPNNSITDAQGAMLRADSTVVQPIGTHQGFAVHFGRTLVIARANRPLFRPASFERLARWTLAEVERRQYDKPGAPQHQERVAKAVTVRSELSAALTRMSAAERAAPGCFTADELEFGSRVALVVPATDTRCAVRMVEPDPNYFDRNLPPSAIQLVTLRVLPTEPPRGGLVGVRRAKLKVDWMNQALFWGTDWSAFRDAVLAAR